MAYETNGFKLLTDGLSGASTMKTWLLDSVDAIATVNTSNYVGDGHARAPARVTSSSCARARPRWPAR